VANGPLDWNSFVRVCREAVWAPVAVLLIHAVAGKLFGHEPYVDPVMHFSGGLAMAFFFQRTCSIASGLFGKPSRLAIDLLAFGLTCAAALFWEFGEFFGDLYRGTHVQRGLGNTMRDLLLGTSGGILYLIAARIRRSQKKRSESKSMTNSSFTVSPDNRYFQDYVAGAVHEFGPIAVEEKDVLNFGQRFVPLPYHVDKEAAKKSIYGGLIASGWHTAALMMRLYTDNYLSRVANLGSPGCDELRWTKPVFPGDELSIRVTVLDTRRSDSKPDRGIVRSFVEVLNQNREVVMTVKMVNFVRSRQRFGAD
jgi:acyl dehydratase